MRSGAAKNLPGTDRDPGGGTINHTNDYTGDPAFVNAAGGDYHIGAGSAAIDKGVDAPVIIDMDGDGRPHGSASDLGADEYTGAAAPTSTPTATVTTGPTPTPTPTTTGTVTCPDLYEPNDTFDDATLINPGVEYDAYICTETDIDYYKFYAAKGQQITMDLYSLPADYDLELYDPARVLEGRSTNGGTLDEQIVHVAEQKGYWYAKVYFFSGSYSTTDPYTLKVALSSIPQYVPLVLKGD